MFDIFLSPRWLMLTGQILLWLTKNCHDLQCSFSTNYPDLSWICHRRLPYLITYINVLLLSGHAIWSANQHTSVSTEWMRHASLSPCSKFAVTRHHCATMAPKRKSKHSASPQTHTKRGKQTSRRKAHPPSDLPSTHIARSIKRWKGTNSEIHDEHIGKHQL